MKPPASREPAPWLAPLLDAAAEFDIEHHGLLSNHLTHAWVVMALTGGTPDDAEWWRELYLGLLEEPHPRHDGGPEPALVDDGAVTVDESNWRDHVNPRRDHYAATLTFTRRLVAERCPSGAVALVVPEVLDGIAGGALHPIIHTGWALEAGHHDMLAEGLAYLITMHQPIGFTDDSDVWTTGEPDLIGESASVLGAAQDAGLPQIAYDTALTPEYTALGRGLFQHRIIAFADARLPLGGALDASAPLRLPGVDDDLDTALEQAAALAAAACLGSRGEFFAVHGLTSLHATVVAMAHLDPDARRRALAHWWRATIATLISQDLPGLDQTIEILTAWRQGAAITTSEPDWHRWHTVARSSIDEHVPKAVFALWRWAVDSGASESTAAVCAAAAADLARTEPGHRTHENLWFAWS